MKKFVIAAVAALLSFAALAGETYTKRYTLIKTVSGDEAVTRYAPARLHGEEIAEMSRIISDLDLDRIGGKVTVKVWRYDVTGERHLIPVTIEVKRRVGFNAYEVEESYPVCRYDNVWIPPRKEVQRMPDGTVREVTIPGRYIRVVVGPKFDL